MMMKMKERIADLLNYIELLKGLMREDFQCQKELKEALHELHTLMFNKRDEEATAYSNHAYIIVFEEDSYGRERAEKVFENLLAGTNYNTKRMTNDTKIDNGIIRIEIMDLKNRDLQKLSDMLRGTRPDYIVNNTNLDVEKVFNIRKKLISDL
jgi:hypothetical protein